MKKRGPSKGRRTEQYQCFSCKLRYPDTEFYKRRSGTVVAECKECAKDRQSIISLKKRAKEQGIEWLEAKIYRLNLLLQNAQQLRKSMEHDEELQ